VRSRGAATNQYIMEIDALEKRVARLYPHMEEQLETWHRKPMVDALMSLRGFQIVTGMTVIAELGDLDRFKSPRQLMGYLGIVVGEDSTGERRRQGSITNVSSVAFSEGGDRQLARALDTRGERQRLREEGDGIARPLQTPGGAEPGGQSAIVARADTTLLPPPQTLSSQRRTKQGDRRHHPRAGRLPVGTRCAGARGARANDLEDLNTTTA